MNWVQSKVTDGQRDSVVRFKCNGCGTTQVVAHAAQTRRTGEVPLPAGWRSGVHPGWHLCSTCGEKTRRVLPVV